MKILLISNAFNGLTQRYWLELRRMGHQVMFETAAAGRQEHLIRQYKHWKPQYVFCPYLTTATPPEIPAIIMHPGPKGDRCRSSLDWCLLKRLNTFGATLLQAEKEMDAGPVYAHSRYQVLLSDASRILSKSSIYRHEVTDSAVSILNECMLKLEQNQLPEVWPVGQLPPLIAGVTQADRAIDWNEHDAAEIVHRVRAADGQPGVLDSKLIPGQSVFMFGAHLETGLNSTGFQPGQIMRYRDGAVLVAACKGTCLWITHLKKQTSKAQLTCIMNAPSFKLPAVYVVPPSMMTTVSEDVRPELFGTYLKPDNTYFRSNGLLNGPKQTWREIWYELDQEVCYLYFEFYNGAMDTEQCRRLYVALKEIATLEQVRVVVLMGGTDAFSNGIHLNVIEAAADPAAESWANINAMNDVVHQIMNMPASQTTVTMFRASAGAGGVMLGLASDYVYASESCVLNPHYGGMGLFGSEYFTYNLPRRVGLDQAQRLTKQLLPVSALEARTMNMIDGLVQIHSNVTETTSQSLAARIENVFSRWSVDSAAKLLRQSDPQWQQQLKAARDYELAQMWDNFRDPVYHRARYQFVHKQTALVTAYPLQSANASAAGHCAIMSGKDVAASIRKELEETMQQIPDDEAPPRLAVIQVGDRADSNLFIRAKKRAGESIGMCIDHLEMELKAQESLAELEWRIIAEIMRLNSDSRVHGILLQLPLPYKQLNTTRILEHIALDKDVDGLRWEQAKAMFLPCAAQAILKLLQVYEVKVRGLHVVVVGASHLLGQPLARELQRQYATVTICDIHTPITLLHHQLLQADVVISAVGKAGLIQNVKPGACVIDAGIMVTERLDTITSTDNSIQTAAQIVVGDVNMESVRNTASMVSCVPNGVGPLTVSILLRQLLQAYQRN